MHKPHVDVSRYQDDKKHTSMSLEFRGDIFFWRGPAPFYFVPVPETTSDMIKEVSNLITYGWGMIPVQVQLGHSIWRTSLFPRANRYLVPLKSNIRKAEKLSEGDTVTINLVLGAVKPQS